MLTDEQMRDVLKNTNHMVRNSMHGPFWPELEGACRAIESAATEPMLQRIAHLEATASANYGRGHTDAHSMLSERIAELEQRNSDLHEDVQRFKKHALNEKAARLELERQLEEARKDAERLDYIQKNARSDPKMDGNHVWWPTTFNQAQNLKGPTIRAAIDAAMRKGKS